MARTWGQGRKLPKSSPIGSQNRFLQEDPTATDGVAWVSSSGVGGLAAENNLSDVDSVSDSRDNLGLGTAAVVDTGYGTGDVPVVSGGTPDGTKFLRDDGAWTTVSGGGGGSGFASTVTMTSDPDTPVTVTHNLGSTDILVQGFADIGAGKFVRYDFGSIRIEDTNSITVKSNGDAEDVRVVISSVS